MRLSDEEYVFQQDIKEKKAAGRGAFHRKCGSKSKKCTLPHERLTKKELEKMNGEVMSYNPKAWYTYEDFKKLPMKYQVEYVNSLLTRYECGLNAISEIVFQQNKSTLNQYFRYKKQTQFINSYGKKGGHQCDAGAKRLKADVEAARTPDEIQNGSKEKTLEEKITEAIDAVTLYASNGVPMPPERVNEIFVEMCGMTLSEAEEATGFTWENPGEPVGDPKYVEATEVPEELKDPTDVKSFSIVMDHIDMAIIQYVSDLFKGKKITVSFEVKEAL